MLVLVAWDQLSKCVSVQVCGGRRHVLGFIAFYTVVAVSSVRESNDSR